MSVYYYGVTVSRISYNTYQWNANIMCGTVTLTSLGVGCQRMGIDEPPADIGKRQALAAVGQIHLMFMFDQLFSALGQRCAQVLLSYENLGIKSQ